MFIAVWILISFILLGGAWFDLMSHRIPNAWILLGASVGLYLYMDSAAGFLIRLCVITALFFPLYCCRMIGAGDIKLMALVCGYCGFRSGGSIIGAAFLAGAVWSFIKLLRSGSLKARLFYFAGYIRRMIQTKEAGIYYSPQRDGYAVTIPFAVCLCLGELFNLIIKIA